MPKCRGQHLIWVSPKGITQFSILHNKIISARATESNAEGSHSWRSDLGQGEIIALDRLDNHLSSGEASGRCDDPYDGHQGRGHAYTARGKDQVLLLLWVSGQTQEFVLDASLVWIFHHPCLFQLFVPQVC